MSRHFNRLMKEVHAGVSGENGVIPLSLHRLSEHVQISKNTMYVVGAETSGAKTSFVMDQFVNEPLLWYAENQAKRDDDVTKINIKLDIILFSMERSYVMTEARLISKLIYEESGYLISTARMVGRSNRKLTDEEVIQIANKEAMESRITQPLKVYEGSQTVESVSAILEEHARINGHAEVIEDDDGKPVTVWVPNHKNHVTLIIIDHIGLISRDKKDIDAFSTLMRKCKDFYGFSPVVLQQLNRDISQNGRSGPKGKPRLSDFEGSASTQHDAEVVIALFNPFVHAVLTGEEDEVLDVVGYNLLELQDDFGLAMYRSAHILKNSFGGAGVSIGLGFFGAIGSFVELPRVSDITDEDYYRVRSKSAFVKFKKDLFS